MASRRGPNTAQLRVRVDVYSDIACPWCYVAKRRLDRAICKWSTASTGCKVEVKWYPYIIDHNTQQGGEDYLAYNIRRWGGDGWTQDLRRSGHPDGALFADWKIWPSTLLAHQLIRMAAIQGGPDCAAQAEDLLFLKTYEQGGNVSSEDELLQVAGQLGLPLDEVRQALRDGTYQAEVLALDLLAKRTLKVSGVPFFIIGATGGDSGDDSPDDLSIIDMAGHQNSSSTAVRKSKQYGLNGAQPVEKLIKIFERVLAEVQK